MPISYKFTRNNDGQTVNLADIDRLICEDYGVTCDDNHYSRAYDLIVDAGITILMRSGGNKVDEAAVDAALATLPEPLPEKDDMVLRRFLYREFTFSAWR